MSPAKAMIGYLQSRVAELEAELAQMKELPPESCPTCGDILHSGPCRPFDPENTEDWDELPKAVRERYENAEAELAEWKRAGSEWKAFKTRAETAEAELMTRNTETTKLIVGLRERISELELANSILRSPVYGGAEAGMTKVASDIKELAERYKVRVAELEAEVERLRNPCKCGRPSRITCTDCGRPVEKCLCEVNPNSSPLRGGGRESGGPQVGKPENSLQAVPAAANPAAPSLSRDGPAFIFPEALRVKTVKEAYPWYREDCPYCMRCVRAARKLRWRLVVNLETWDAVAVVP